MNEINMKNVELITVTGQLDIHLNQVDKYLKNKIYPDRLVDMKKKKIMYVEELIQFHAEVAAIEEAKRLALEQEQQQLLQLQLEQAKKASKKKNKKKKK